MSDLDLLVKEYYKGQALSEDRLAAIRSAAGKADARWYWRLAASLAAVVIGFGVLHYHLRQRDVAELLFAEVAMNHGKQLEVEVASRDYSVLRSRMDRLDFTITPPEAVPATYELIGGRYCSIRGNIAAQLKLRHKSTDDIFTLYVTKLVPDLARVAGRESVRGDVRIRLWSEDGLFFALAGPDGDQAGLD